MHFKALVVVNIPPVQENEEETLIIRERIDRLEAMQSKDSENPAIEWLLEWFNNLRTGFSRAIVNEVNLIMDKYGDSPSDQSYLEFVDETDYIHEEYAKNADCIKLPQGTIVMANSYPYYRQFTIRDGKVFQRNAGPLRQEKRTKKAKRMTALPSYPLKKIYKDFSDFAANYYGAVYDEVSKKWGCYTTPNAIYDYYQIGGRWSDRFLVKSDCTECSFGNRGFCQDKEAAPDGYMWVNAARKKDIQWRVMHEWHTAKIKKQYMTNKEIFESGQLPPDEPYEITKDGLLYYGEKVYTAGMPLEDYITRLGYSKKLKYPVHVDDIIDYENRYADCDYPCDSDGEENRGISLWEKKTDEYIAALPDDAVLVGVDYHT